MKITFIYKILLIIIVLVFCNTQLSAKHIIGGDVYYSCLGQNPNNTTTFKIDVVIYRDPIDPEAADFDDDALFGIWSNEGNGWKLISTRAENFSNKQQVDINSVNPCVIIPPNVGVERAEYSFNLTLDNIAGEYLIAYQRCCRNNSISNIVDPQSTGAVFAVTISEQAQLTCNNSPRFKEFPPVVICNGLQLEFDHGATDTEGDQVVYEFCAPRASGGQNNTTDTGSDTCSGVVPSPEKCSPPWGFVEFQQPLYTTTNPLGGDPQVVIDPNTGMITGVPTINGQFVVGVCAKEYRNGVLISEIRRDFQFNVTSCEPAIFAVVENDELIGDKEFVINSCGNNIVEFKNQSYNIEYIVGYDWSFDINGQMEHFDTRDVTVEFPDLGLYEGMLIVNPNTSCADTAIIHVNIFPEIVADFEYIYDTCVAGEIQFKDLSYTGANSILDWEWKFDENSTSYQKNPKHLYSESGIKNVSLVVTDNNNCSDILVEEVVYQPAPPILVVAPNKFVGCAPAKIFFENLSSPIGEDYLVEWDFGQDSISTDISPSVIYENPGLYTIHLKVTSPIGCEIEKTFKDFIRIEESPIAAFTYSPETLNNFNSEVTCIDQSLDAVSWQWNFGDQSNSFIQNPPPHTYRDTGVYEIQLIVKHESNCTDTAFATIDVQPQTTYHVPNAFTPNYDGVNDVFIGKGYLDAIRDYEMRIWNRWGEEVYYTNDQRIGWNGTKNNNGNNSPIGVYVYVIRYIGPRGENEELKGHVTLLR